MKLIEFSTIGCLIKTSKCDHHVIHFIPPRLIDQKDRETFFDMVNAACQNCLRLKLSHTLAERLPEGTRLNDQIMRDLVFGNYMEPDADPKYYDEVTDWNKLENVMNYYMKEYNADSNSPMDLVLFRFAIEHISR